MRNKIEVGKIETHTFQGAEVENFYGWFYKARGNSMHIASAAIAENPQKYTLEIFGQPAMIERALKPEVITVVTFEGSKANTAIRSISRK